MKRFSRIALPAVALALLASSSFAADGAPNEAETQPSTLLAQKAPASEAGEAQAGEAAQDHSEDLGEPVHVSEVDGYELTYHIVDIRDKIREMPKPPDPPVTHHLMAFVKGPDGKPVLNGKAGFLIAPPLGERQMAMAMGMAGGYGVNVNLNSKGMHEIKFKIVDGDRKVLDGFPLLIK